MKKNSQKVVVRKWVAERVMFWIMAGVLFLIWIWFAAQSTSISDSLLALLVFLAICLPLPLYLEIWSITLTDKEIHIRRLFYQKTYTYHMVKEVTRERFTSEGYPRIRCVFRDGKSVSFSEKDVNAAAAIRRLSRFSIREIRYNERYR